MYDTRSHKKHLLLLNNENKASTTPIPQTSAAVAAAAADSWVAMRVVVRVPRVGETQHHPAATHHTAHWGVVLGVGVGVGAVEGGWVPVAWVARVAWAASEMVVDSSPATTLHS